MNIVRIIYLHISILEEVKEYTKNSFISFYFLQKKNVSLTE